MNNNSQKFLESDSLAGTLLGILLDEGVTLLSTDELARRLAGASGNLRSAEVSVHDGLSDLAAHGLVHQIDGFVFASQAAVRCHSINS